MQLSKGSKLVRPMRIISLRIGIFLLALSSLSASNFMEDFLLEARAAYFLPTDSSFKEIYGGGGLYSLEGSYHKWTHLYPWISAGIFQQSGHTKAENTKTYITIVPIALGLKYQFIFNRIKPYLGLGVQPTYIHTKDESSFVVKIRKKWGVGAIPKSGVIFDVTNHFVIDLFVDYSWIKVRFQDTNKTIGRTVNASGFSFGGGIGYRF